MPLLHSTGLGVVLLATQYIAEWRPAAGSVSLRVPYGRLYFALRCRKSRADRNDALGNWLTADLAPIRAEADPRLRWSSLLIADPEGTRYVVMRGWRHGA